MYVSLHVFPTHDAELVNRIANSDSVRPTFHPQGQVMDWTDAVERPSLETGIICLTNGEDAVGAFVQTTRDVFQCHWLFDKTCRGRRALDTCQAMVDWLRARGVTKPWGTTPLTNKAALWFNRKMGAVPTWTDGEEQVFEYRMAG